MGTHYTRRFFQSVVGKSKDDMILDLAVRAPKSRGPFIVTYNTRDFSGVKQFGIQVVTAQEFLKAIEVI